VKPVPEWLQKYVDRGFRLVFYPTKRKGPVTKGWEAKTFTAADYKEGDNVGVMCGHEIQPGKFLVDIDFDWAEGVPLAKRLLPPTEFGFGRDSRKLSHAFYTAGSPLVTRVFDDVDGKRIVEMRALSSDGTLGHQTMIPPSVHPSEEIVTLRMDGAIGHDDNVERRVVMYAIGCLLFQHLGQRGLLHDVRLALGGFLLKVGLTEEETITIGEAIAEITGNNINDVETTVRSTASRLKQGERVVGKQALEKAIGDQGKNVTARIKQWLGIKDFIVNDKGAIIANKEENIVRGLNQLGAEVLFDDFSQRAKVKYNGFNGMLMDEQRNRMLLDLDKHFHFSPSAERFDMVLMDMAYHNRKHPVREYLESVEWDGKPRVDEWLIKFGGAADTEYVRAVSAIVLIAAVKRVRSPGCKVDEMLVLESPQGQGKSSALRALCPKEDWFSDDFPMNVDSKEVIERTVGKWIIEAAELSGVRKAMSEHLKSMVSRQTDGPVRMAYARLPMEQPRQFIIIGTTNSTAYLKDETGNRRFWPVRVKVFDVPGIISERDQIWAEAAAREAKGERSSLHPSLWPMAGLQQERRRIEDPWEVLLDSEFPLDQKIRITPEKIWEALGIQPEKRDERGQERIIKIMQRLQFRRVTVRSDDGKATKGWGRDVIEGNLQLELEDK